MSDSCDPYREYLGALADGELELVPLEAADHAQRCEDCAAEVAAHGLISERLREALVGQPVVEETVRRRRLGLKHVLLAPAAAATIAAAVLAGALAWDGGSSDLVVTAAAATRSAPAMYSADPTRIATWCAHIAATPPVVHLPWLLAEGARVDVVDGTKIVTVYYTVAGTDRLSLTAGNGHVAVAWIASLPAAAGQAAIGTRDVAGRSVLVVGTAHGTAVVSGDASMSTLWGAAGALAEQSATLASRRILVA